MSFAYALADARATETRAAVTEVRLGCGVDSDRDRNLAGTSCPLAVAGEAERFLS